MVHAPKPLLHVPGINGAASREQALLTIVGPHIEGMANAVLESATRMHVDLLAGQFALVELADDPAWAAAMAIEERARLFVARKRRWLTVVNMKMAGPKAEEELRKYLAASPELARVVAAIDRAHDEATETDKRERAAREVVAQDRAPPVADAAGPTA